MARYTGLDQEKPDMILVDTSTWIDFLRGVNSPERRLLHKLIENSEDIAITGIILAEILQGIKDEGKCRVTRDYLLEFPVYEPEWPATYIEAARIYGLCRKRGQTVRSTIDCIIAAICLEHDLPLLHKDRDYNILGECAGLKIIQVEG